MKKLIIGMLGCGNVGGGVYRLLQDFKAELAQRYELEVEIRRILVKDVSDPRLAFVTDKALLTENVGDVVDDPAIQLVAEFMGGEHPAADFMLRALNNGKTVVTANKVALAPNWAELENAAKAHGAGLYYEASVCGAIPIIRSMMTSLTANRVTELMGIVNGTTNYILSRMSDNGEAYADVLADAQRLGLAEPDPTTDVEGYDAAFKLSILASLAFHNRIPVEKVYREGITGVTAMDIACGKEAGYVLKLLAIAKRNGNTAETRVHPTFIPKDHPLAGVNSSFNAVYLKGHACQEMMFQGRGAGDMPTASAIVADIIAAALAEEHKYPTFLNEQGVEELHSHTDWMTGYFIRLSVLDKPGMLGTIARTLGDHGISIESLFQKESVEEDRVPLIIITHKAHEQALRAALKELKPEIARVDGVIRVEK